MPNLSVEEIFELANEAGCEAVAKTKVIPMIVGHAKSIFSNEIDYSRPVEVVNDGVCGFAWVNIKPANSKFAKFLVERRLARKDSYYGGVSMSISNYNQSMTKKEAYAYAFASVLAANGIRAYATSRMD